MSNTLTPQAVAANIAKGVFKPHIYLTNLSLAYFQESAGYISKKMFPVVPVNLSTAKYYEFDKGDLTRLAMQRKPAFGHVQPAVFGKRDHLYNCEVDQVITGIDAIASLDFERTHAPGSIDPRRARARFISEQMNLYLEDVWAKKFFVPNAWNNVYEGVDTNPTGKQFFQFDNENCDPVKLFNSLAATMRQFGLRKPNKIGCGLNVYGALQTNPSVLERIKYQGSEASPASVTANVLAQLFGVKEFVVSEAVINRTKIGTKDDLQFVCGPDSLLLCYATDSPAIDEPSAGYTFAWDMLGNGQYLAVQHFLGQPGTHSEFIEGLLAADHQIAAPDLGVFLKNCVSPDWNKGL
jgi:hypothetical protein